MSRIEKIIHEQLNGAIIGVAMEVHNELSTEILSETAIRFGAVLDSIDADNFVRVINPVKNAPIKGLMARKGRIAPNESFNGA